MLITSKSRFKWLFITRDIHFTEIEILEKDMVSIQSPINLMPHLLLKIVSEYDQEISQTADTPVAP